MSNPCLILEWSDSANWASLVATTRRIPEGAQPKMLQPDRATAEAEAERLALRFPTKRFAVFEAAVEARVTTVPSHINLQGEVWASRQVAVLVDIDDEQVPF